jgi:cell division protein FtsW
MTRRLFWVVLVLVVFGLVVLSSASVVESAKDHDGSASYYWTHQLLWGVLPGLIALWAFWKMDYRHLRLVAFPLLVVSLGLTALVFVPSLGHTYGGSTNWLSFGPVRFQPAELVKLALVVYLAAWLGNQSERVSSWQLGLLPFGLVMAVVAGLILAQGDVGTLVIILMIAAGVYFAAGAPMKQTAAIILVAIVLVGGFIASSAERTARVLTVIRPQEDVRGEGYQLNQSLIAMGSGGVWGVGLGQGIAKFGRLPEPMGDSVYAVLVEELGLAGGLATLGLFGLLGFLLASAARKAHDGFGALMAVGMLVWVLAQSAVNMMSFTGLIPLTGLPLPFFSYGGSAMATLLAGMGIVLSVAKRADSH